MHQKILKCIALSSMIIGLLSCVEKGCMDPSAINYNIGAKKDDSSCEYASNDIFSGPYSFTLMANGIMDSYDTNAFRNHFFYANKDYIDIDTTIWVEHTANFKNFNNGNSPLIVSFYTNPDSINQDSLTLSNENIEVRNFQLADLIPPIDMHNKISLSRIENGKIFSTLYGSQQSGNFIIQKKQEVIHDGSEGFKIQIQFNGILYNQNNLQETIAISNGEALIFLKN